MNTKFCDENIDILGFIFRFSLLVPERLLHRCDYLRRWQFIETRAGAFKPPLAAFELTRRAGERVLHQPDIAAALHGPGGRPDGVEAARRPWAPKPRVGRSVERDGRAARGGGKVRDRSIGPDINARIRQECGQLRPIQLAVEPPD